MTRYLPTVIGRVVSPVDIIFRRKHVPSRTIVNENYPVGWHREYFQYYQKSERPNKEPELL